VAPVAEPIEIAEALAIRVAVLAADQADELVGRRQTRAAFRRWGERLPADLAPAGDIEILLERHAATWLREAETFARQIDPGLVSRGIHVADYETLGITSPNGSGFAYPAGLFEVVRHRLPADAAPGHVLAINLPAHAATVADAVDDADEAALVEAVAMSLCGTVAHELAHLAEFDASDRRLPGDIDFEVFRLAAARPAGNQAQHHGPQWIRALAHATHRADRHRPAYFWWRLFRDDVRSHVTACPGDITVALDHELAEINAPLADILRRPAPAAFTDLFHDPAAPAA
jgi:hypothetical protein